MLIKDFI